MKEKLVCGIEIHQQLDTKKLFCSCKSDLCDEGNGSYYRRLRPTAGETGKIDRAALVQYKKGIGFKYQMCDVSCLVDIDEEPPHDADEDAMDTALMFSLMLGSNIVDEVHFMRKIVVDGSNTSGYQRTALIATGGSINVNGKEISILSVCLEEDAARKISEDGNTITYRLDRLGIPLIEVATGPDITSPEEAMEAALKIGTLLRATKKVKRGIGTIREDMNISIPDGARIEIKGVQELRLIPVYVETEVKRQRMLVDIKNMLAQRNITNAECEITDVTELFKDCRSKVIVSVLSEKGAVLATKLPGFAGTMNGDNGRLRLGAEMAQRARTKGVSGIFHSDELPAYGIEQSQVDILKKELDIKGNDAFVLCAAGRTKAKDALTAVIERANEAIAGVPEETRDPMPDGSSRYSRPLPGAARMYPETDVPPIRITKERIQRIKDNLPELPEEIEKRLIQEYKINAQQAKQIVRNGDDELFEKIAAKEFASVAATTLLNTFAEMVNDGSDPYSIDDNDIMTVFSMLKDSKFSKEALPSIFREMVNGASVQDAVRSLGLEHLSRDEASKIISKIVKERESFVKEKGMAAIGPLMGPVMEAMRGKIDGKIASELLTEEVRRLV